MSQMVELPDHSVSRKYTSGAIGGLVEDPRFSATWGSNTELILLDLSVDGRYSPLSVP